jgi:WD40 repeat protein
MRMFQAHDRKRVKRVRFSPDARIMSVVLRAHGLLVHLETLGGAANEWRPDVAVSPEDVAYSPDGEIIGVGTPHRVVTYRVAKHSADGAVLDRATRFDYTRLTDFDSPPGGASAPTSVSMAFSPTTNPLITRLGIASSELLVWNPHTQEYIYVADDTGEYRGISFGPDGLTVASIEYHVHALCVWNVKPRSVLFRTDLKGINTFDNGSVAMMPDGERVIVAAGELLRCVPLHGTGGWDTPVKKPLLEIALHPRGHILLVADGSKKVTAYDTSNGKAAAQYDWGVGKVGCVTYSPDGTLAAAGGEKGQVVVWDAE